uniref:CSON015311 protein n=1 Tax=Culicoides sonorensis TaxID=179676 RepID=A0A336K4B4_CULSO
MVGLGPGETGEILVRGSHIMKGYYKNETATNETIAKNGWLKTGDIGYYKDSQFYITDRLKELIKVKGFQVAPAELEEVLRSHPHVADAAVIGVPNPVSGELPRGYVVAKPNVKINEEDVLNYVQTKVAVYKRLESVVVINEIPKNATGKILRRELKLQFK